MTGEFVFKNGGWYWFVEKEKDIDCIHVPITDVPELLLLEVWEDLVNEQSDKEVKLLQLKEYVNMQSFKLEQEVNFKELYGKNNADVRKHHIKQELSDVYEEISSLELSINWIKQYIPLLREVIRVKQS